MLEMANVTRRKGSASDRSLRYRRLSALTALLSRPQFVNCAAIVILDKKRITVSRRLDVDRSAPDSLGLFVEPSSDQINLVTRPLLTRPRKDDDLIPGLTRSIPGTMVRDGRRVPEPLRQFCFLQKGHAQRRRVSLDPLIAARKPRLRIFVPVRIVIVIRVERHVIQTARTLRVRFSEWPPVVRSRSNMNKCIWRMVIDVGSNAFAKVILAASFPASVIWESNIVTSVDHRPQSV